MGILIILAYLLITLLSLAYYALHKHYNYWAARGVLHDKPLFIYGNMKGVGKTKPLTEPFRDFYLKYKGKALFGGFYLHFRKAAFLLDLDLAKKVFISDFADFSARGIYSNEEKDPLSAHLLNLDGPEWKQMRAKMTPTFTSGKMKFMFSSIVEVGERFVAVLKEMPNKDCLEIGDFLARYTTDVIGSCAFGIECNSLKDPNTKFRQMGKKVFTDRRNGRISFAFAQAFPKLARKLGIYFYDKNVTEFFMKVVKDTVAYREREAVQRNDFLNLMMELKNDNKIEGGLTIEQIAAQAFVFFLAGFETSSSAMGFALYELALHQDMQQKVRKEINDVFKTHLNQMTYEAMKELKYLQQIFDETLRKYPIASLTLRKCTRDYHVPNTNHIIEKDTMVVLAIDAIHHDPELYPNPEEFIPERFTPDEIAKRHPMAYIPFGEGPRNCIGLRFGKMQAMVGLTFLLKNFRFTLNKKTTVPLVFSVKSLLQHAEGGIHLTVEDIVE